MPRFLYLSHVLLQVYGPIFGMGLALAISGFLSAAILGALITDENMENVSSALHSVELSLSI